MTELKETPPQVEDESSLSTAFPGVIARQRHPDNLEFPFPTLSSFLTPNEQFYVRTHFETPNLDARTWQLEIAGAVERPLTLDYDELRRMPSRTVTALLECSGNSRGLLEVPQLGVRWDQGAVSNAEWIGVPLADVLARAGVEDAAVEVILEGADQGSFEKPEPPTPGSIPYARSLPLHRARRPEILLAYQMNGEDLLPQHGFPVRVIVPGWYGMASVKWLQRIEVTDRPFHGYFQTLQYAVWERRGRLPDLVPVSEIQIKAQIARPMLHEVIPAGAPYRVFGAAWAGDADVAHVDVSTDRGRSWSHARLLGQPVRHAWRLWEHHWMTPAQPAHCTLMARATDDRGHSQPMERNQDLRDAMISHVQPIDVFVR